MLELAYDEVDYISCHAYYEVLDGDVDSFLASAVDMDHFIDSVVATADAVGARLEQQQADRRSRSTSGTSGTSSRFQRRPARRVGGGAAAHRGQLRRRRRRRRRQPADLAAAPQRPRGRRLPGPARQRDRADPHRARRPGVAADDLPPVRADLAAGARPGAARGHRARRPTRPPASATCRSSTRSPPTTRRPATTVLFAVNRSSTEPVELSVPLADLGAVYGRRGLDRRTNPTRPRPTPRVPRPGAAARRRPPTVADGTLRVVLPPVSWIAVRLAH